MTSSELFGNALWISSADGETAPYMRREFDLPGVIRGELTVCGLGFFEAYLNGQSVSEDLFAPAVSDYEAAPERTCEKTFGEETRHRVYVMRYDVTELLREGPNCLGVRLFPGWYVNERHNRPGRVRLCFRLVWESADGEVGCVISDEGVKWTRSEVIPGNFFRGEDQDAAFAQDGFSRVGYPEEGWRPAEPTGAPDAPLYLQTCPPDRIVRHVRPQRIGRTPEGADLYDCGEVLTGWPVLLDGGGEARTLRLVMAEALKDGALDPDAVHRQVCTYRTNGTPRAYRSRSMWHAFRYFTVEGGARCEDVCVVHTDTAVNSSFSCSDPVITWIYEAFVRTQLANMHMCIPSDCPHIERRGYTGDGQLACDAAMACLDAKAFYRKWIDDISDCQDVRSGHVQYTAPYTQSGGGPGGWGCAIVEVPWRFWRAYGDAEPARRLFPQMLRYFDYLEAHSEDGLVVSDQPGEWCLGDWCTPEPIAIPAPYVNGYFFIRSLRHAADAAMLAGLPEQAAELRRRAEEKTDVLKAHFYDAATGDFCENVQGANLFALDLGIGDDRTLDHAVQTYTDGPLDTGIFGTDLLFSVLFENGFSELACEILGRRTHPSYGYWMDLGATTLWEEWKGTPRSRCHPMFGAPVATIFRFVLGIRQAPGTVGWTHAVISPAFNRRVTSARGHLTLPSGRLAVDWHVEDGEAFLHVEADPGVCATVEVGGDCFPVPAGKSSYILPLDL